jgi:predicted membrane-bound spermidine synthase
VSGASESAQAALEQSDFEPDAEAEAVHAFVLVTAGCLAVAVHHAFRAGVLYAAPDGAALTALGAAALGLGGGVLASFWLVPFAETALRGTLLAVALCAALTSFAPFVAFASGAATPVALGCIALLVGASVTAGVLAHRGVARASLALGLVPFVLAPSRLAGALGVLLVVEVALAHAGFLRSGLGVAALLVVAAEAYPRPRAFLHAIRDDSAARLWTRAAIFVATGAAALVAAESLLPAEWLTRFPDEIVFARNGSASEYAVVASPAGYELYTDGQLALSPLDEARRTAALVRPVLSAAARAERVLLVFGGLGSVERALLADARVKELVTLAPDPARFELGRGLPMLRARSRGALDSPRVRKLVAEPLAWLAANSGATFDVIVADLPLPLGYREGKYYTRFAFDRLARALGPEGVLVVPGISGDALGGVLATLDGAGLRTVAYHAAVPTLGVTSYVLASREGVPAAPSGALALDAGADLGAVATEHVATLSDQWIVGAFETARERR